MYRHLTTLPPYRVIGDPGQAHPHPEEVEGELLEVDVGGPGDDLVPHLLLEMLGQLQCNLEHTIKMGSQWWFGFGFGFG